LKRQARFKADWNGQPLHMPGFEVGGAVDESTLESVSEEQMIEQIRTEVLQGAYYLIDYRGYAGYEPGDNVVNIFAMGAMGTEAIKASEELLKRGIYANVIMVTSTDLLLGVQAHADNYNYLKNYLGIDASLHLQPLPNGNAEAGEVATLSGRRIPCVSVHDGEPGLLDNLGSVVGVKQECLAVRKHSRTGRPADIYAYHHIDAASVVEAAGKVLSETALEEIKLSPRVIEQLQGAESQHMNWRQLWPDEKGYTGDRH
jgi:pyruvate dehydrogenase E1 component